VRAEFHHFRKRAHGQAHAERSQLGDLHPQSAKHQNGGPEPGTYLVQRGKHLGAPRVHDDRPLGELGRQHAGRIKLGKVGLDGTVTDAPEEAPLRVSTLDLVRLDHRETHSVNTGQKENDSHSRTWFSRD
jgi:hypothetical protein